MTTQLVLCTVPDQQTGRELAGKLVQHKLAACVNILPGITSVYTWQGEVEEESEALLLVKTTQARYPELERQLQAWHPYDVPEIIATDINAGLSAYLTWVNEETQ